MPRHSKNNTALSFFTYAEGKALKYGTKKQGHLYCKECILENLLAQKREIRRQQNLLEARAKDEIEESKRKEQLAKEAVIHDFERQQVRIAPLGTKMEESMKTSNKSTKTTDNSTKTNDNGKTPNSTKSVKAIEYGETLQDFRLDEDEVEAIALREQQEAMKRLDEEQVFRLIEIYNLV
ncbi:14526_t:CDS:2 [Racocetra fulgida]|uniref:14526_t:CDS:1 n=1 Tax=Racocetra fulgida TaxID=60492 RepID=A0A9N8VP54_9GLOM|nr:14526_t:CDS:2 [Racocetra fulgida]